MLRNDRVYSYQTNRNPFIDHPKWVNLTFAPAHTIPPVLHITGMPPTITLSWLATNQSTRLEFSTNIVVGWSEATAISFGRDEPTGEGVLPVAGLVK